MDTPENFADEVKDSWFMHVNNIRAICHCLDVLTDQYHSEADLPLLENTNRLHNALFQAIAYEAERLTDKKRAKEAEGETAGTDSPTAKVD